VAEDLTGSDGIGDVGSGGGTSEVGRSSDDLDSEVKVATGRLPYLPETGLTDDSGISTSTNNNRYFNGCTGCLQI